MSDDLRKYLPTAETLKQRSDPKTSEEIQRQALDNPALDEALEAMKPRIKEGEDPLFFDLAAAEEQKRRASLPVEQAAAPPAQPPVGRGLGKIAWRSALLAILAVMSPVTGLWLWTHAREPAREAALPVVEAGSGRVEASAPPAACTPMVVEVSAPSASVVATALPSASSSSAPGLPVKPLPAPKRPAPSADAGAGEPAFPSDMLQ